MKHPLRKGDLQSHKETSQIVDGKQSLAFFGFPPRPLTVSFGCLTCFQTFRFSVLFPRGFRLPSCLLEASLIALSFPGPSLGLLGQLRGAVCLLVTPRPSTALCMSPRALRLTTALADLWCCPEASVCLSLPTVRPLDASKCQLWPSVGLWVPPRALPLPFCMAL